MNERSYVNIDRGQILNNLKIYRNYCCGQIMAVVKADAYGHGAVEVATLLQHNGVCAFAVSNINEAIELRENGIEGLILILGYTPINRLHLVKKYNITQALISDEYTQDVINSEVKIRCHYAIDTGMNRIGLNADNKNSCVKSIELAFEKLELTGLFTHLCVADTPEQEVFTFNQIEKFRAVANSVSHLKLPEVHCLNSAGGLWYQTDISCFSRLGIILYGLKPDYLNELPAGIKPVLTWKTVISMIKTVYPGETIGYGRSFEVKKEMRVATIPTGYADGYSRELSNKGFVIIHGKKAHIVGRICMDQFMVDVTDIPQAKNYDEVILIGEEFTADDMAHLIGTIGYEVVCGISKRVERRYCE